MKLLNEKWLQMLYSIKPYIPTVWNKRCGRYFQSNLRCTLLEVHEKITNILNQAPNFGCGFRLNAVPSEEKLSRLTPREFLIFMYKLNPTELGQRGGRTVSGHLNDAIDIAEKALLRHVVRTNVLNQAVVYFRLRVSGEVTKIGLSGLNRKEDAQFSSEQYLMELEAANVPKFYYSAPHESQRELILAMYNALPDSVKDTFFSFDFLGRPNSQLPFYLMRDLFLFVDDDRWSQLKSLCESDDKKAANEAMKVFLCDFLEYERRNNGFKLGASTKNASDSQYLSPKALAYLELIKLPKHIGLTQQGRCFDDEED